MGIGFDSDDEDVVFPPEVTYREEADGAIVVTGGIPQSGVMDPYEHVGRDGRRYRGYSVSIDTLTGFVRLTKKSPASS